ncbi:MAG: tetratricopeptide repeat protein [Candidatus Acidiferrales bacterium]
MPQTAIKFALLFLLATPAFPAQQQGQQQDQQQGAQDKQPPKDQSQQGQQQNQKQTGQDPSDSDEPPVAQESSSKKPIPTTEKRGKDALPDQPPPISSDAEKAKADANAKYDPFPAQQDIEVGMYYYHKGDVDAAIDRFLDAIQRRPNFAKPRLLLGRAYERKHDYESAVKYYKEYLQVFPHAPDAKEVTNKIEKLSKKTS